MRKILVLSLLLLAFSLACKKNARIVDAQPSPTPANLTPIAVPSVVVGKEYPGKGVVVLINKKEGWIEIDHEEIKDLMPAMQMEWTVKNPAHLDRVKVGDKVDFIVVETGRGEVITDLKKVK